MTREYQLTYRRFVPRLKVAGAKKHIGRPATFQLLMLAPVVGQQVWFGNRQGRILHLNFGYVMIGWYGKAIDMDKMIYRYTVTNVDWMNGEQAHEHYPYQNVTGGVTI